MILNALDTPREFLTYPVIQSSRGFFIISPAGWLKSCFIHNLPETFHSWGQVNTIHQNLEGIKVIIKVFGLGRTNDYSYRKASTGLAAAVLMVWALMMIRAGRSVKMPVKGNAQSGMTIL